MKSTAQTKMGAIVANPSARIRAYAQSHGWKVLKIYGPSPTAKEPAARRSALVEAVEEACRRRAVLVVGRLSDLAGSVAGVLQICGQLHEAGAHLAVIKEKIDTTQDGGFFFGVMMALAKVGTPRVAAAPRFGFSLAEDGVHAVVNPQQQEVIRQMVAWRAEGLSHREIAARLKSNKIAGPAGTAWNDAAVRAVLVQAPTARWDGLEEAE